MYENVISSFVERYDNIVDVCNGMARLNRLVFTGQSDNGETYNKKEARERLAIDMLAVAHYVMAVDGQLTHTEINRFNAIFTRYGLTMTVDDSLKNARLALDRIGTQRQVPITIVLFTHYVELMIGSATGSERARTINMEIGQLEAAIDFLAAICCEMAAADKKLSATEYNRIFDFIEDSRSYIEQKLSISFRIPESTRNIIKSTFSHIDD